ncbi:MAG: NAD-dependent DNA ligase LigA [Mycoplasma sp.]
MKQKIKQLVEQLNKWNVEYYQNNNPTVDDATYDLTLRELKKLEEENPEFILPNSPTQVVGDDLQESSFEKTKHERPVLSLNNAFDKNDLQKFENDVFVFDKDNGFVVEPKLDGSHVVVTYQNGKLIRLATRGNGVIGDDITEHAKYIKGIPLRIDCKEHLVIDGEVLINNDDFNKINSELPEEEMFLNSRNIAAGSLRTKDMKVVKERKLTAYFYEAYSNTINFDNDFTQMQLLNFLKEQGFNVENKVPKLFKSVEEAWNYIETLNKEKSKLNVPLDGLVLKLNNRKYNQEIGTTSKFPKYNIAYKFPPTIKQTKVIDIETTVGRTGKITYVAKLKPVEIDGVIVSNVTLHNYDYIVEKDIKLGDTVELYRSGMVIPKINKTLTELRTGEEKDFPMPSTCPDCNSSISKTKDGDVDFFCLNPSCDSKILNQLIYFCSRESMDLVGISAKTLEKFRKAGFIKNSFLDIYDIPKYKDEILNGDFNIKEKSWNNIVNSIEKSKSNSLEKLLCSLGINGVGRTMAKKLSKQFHSIEKISSLTYEELLNVQDVGETTARGIIDWFKDNQHIVIKLKEIGFNTDYINDSIYEIDNTNPFYQKTICVTGSFSNHKRDDLFKTFEDRFGAIKASGVSSKTNFLVVGENAGSKLKKAQDLGITIITEKELEKILNPETITIKKPKTISL